MTTSWPTAEEEAAAAAKARTDLLRAVHEGERVAAAWNAEHPVGTHVHYWAGTREPDPRQGRRTSRTRSRAWVLASGQPVVQVWGHGGGIALTHVEVAS